MTTIGPYDVFATITLRIGDIVSSMQARTRHIAPPTFLLQLLCLPGVRLACYGGYRLTLILIRLNIVNVWCVIMFQKRDSPRVISEAYCNVTLYRIADKWV